MVCKKEDDLDWIQRVVDDGGQISIRKEKYSYPDGHFEDKTILVHEFEMKGKQYHLGVVLENIDELKKSNHGNVFLRAKKRKLTKLNQE